jgi:hypothetical protein
MDQIPPRRTAKRTKFDPIPAPDPTPDETNKYAKKVKIGKPTIGRSPNYVESIGLGTVRVLTANGYNADV